MLTDADRKPFKKIDFEMVMFHKILKMILNKK